MHSRFGKRGALVAGLLVLAIAAMTPSVAAARPEPGVKPRGFRLFALSLGAMTINRIYCGLATTGEVCVDSTNSSTIGGGFWPKGTPDQYVFNSGLRIAGVIGGSKPANPWGGDTTGAFFFDARGDNGVGQEVEPIYNAKSPDDVANWPAEALVPAGDVSADIFNPLLQGRVSASQGDVWWMSWEGDPAHNNGRPHPMGIVVEQRGMGWNFPSGNEDIIYFVYTFYNITSTRESDYAAIRPAMRAKLLEKAQQFQALNNAAFGITLPPEGYAIEHMFAAFGADMDVGSAGENYSTVELPFALGNTYQRDFGQPSGWQFDPGIFAAPLFPGVGFVGVKYLKSPTGPGAIQLFGNTINGGVFGDARNTTQLWRYLSGNISTAAGDQSCTFNPITTHLCYINNTAKADMRFFQSSTELSLPPGGSGSIVVAYIFAAPAKVASFVPGGATDLKPGNPLRFASPDSLAARGSNMVDSLAGFLDYTDVNHDSVAQQNEYKVVPGSLLGKALVAQFVFDNKFLLPFAPESPEFFLVPGDNQVTVLWRPTTSETTGDPFFQLAKDAMVVPPGGGAPVVNPLYDPNYREFDVEGYRVYRGRVDNANALTLLAQFDYAGTSIRDYSGFVNPAPGCAPELGVFTDCPGYVPAEFAPGVTRTHFVEVPLQEKFSDGSVSLITQIKAGERALLADGTAYVTKADTLVTGLDSGNPPLADTGVPFSYVDHAVRNNFRYFYVVTAFDVNSFASGNSSLESSKSATKAVTPHVGATTAQYAVTTTQSDYGRGIQLTDNVTPTIDPATGRFSKMFPPANGWDAAFNGYVAQIVKGSGTVIVRLDSIQLGSAYGNIPGTYFLTIQPGQPSESHTSYTVLMGQTDGETPAVANFSAAPVDPESATNFGVAPDFVLGASITSTTPGAYYTAAWGRGCVNAAEGFDSGQCSYQGARWFNGPSPASNETKDNPNAPGNQEIDNFGTIPYTFAAGYNNAGELAGVTTIYEPHSYLTVQSTYREVEGAIGYAARAADFNVYWGTGGKVDSVIDVTHNVPVPFDSILGGGWGILNASAGAAGGSRDGRPAVLSLFDWGCVQPLHDLVGGNGARLKCGTGGSNPVSDPFIPGPVFKTDSVAQLGPIAMITGFKLDSAPAMGKAPQPNPGFSMYLAGHLFFFELPALPASGTVWSMRSYVGAIQGGNGGPPGDEGPYTYADVHKRQFTAVGAEVRMVFDAVNQQSAASVADLDKVHTVPDPYYVTNEFEQSTDVKVLKFVNLPAVCTIRIYSSSGVLVDVIEHNSITADGTESWNLQNRNHQVVASGVYFYHIEAGDARRVGRFTVVNFAQ